MIPLVRAMERIPMDRAKPGELTAAGLENFEDLRTKGGRTDRVHEKLYRDPLTRFLGECLGESPPDLAIPEDVLLHGDREAGRFDCLEHGGIELVAVVVDFDSISIYQRHPGCTCHGGPEFGRLGIEVRIERVNGGM